MKSLIHIIFLSAILYQSFGVLPDFDVTISSEQMALRDAYSKSDDIAPYMVIQIPKSSENFAALNFCFINENVVRMNGVFYDLVSTKILNDFIELNVFQSKSNFTTEKLKKEKDFENKGNGSLAKKQGLSFVSLMPVAPFEFEAKVLIDNSADYILSAYNFEISSGFKNNTAPPPRA